MGVETKLLQFRRDPFGVVFVVGRTDVVRTRGEALHVSAEILRAGNGAQFLFPLAFGAGKFGGVAKKRLLVSDDVMADRSKRDAGKENGSKDDTAGHELPPKKRRDSVCRAEKWE